MFILRFPACSKLGVPFTEVTKKNGDGRRESNLLTSLGKEGPHQGSDGKTASSVGRGIECSPYRNLTTVLTTMSSPAQCLDT